MLVPSSDTARRLVAPPSSYYFSGDDALRVTTFGSLTGVVVSVEGLLYTAEAGVVPFVIDHTPTSDRTIATTTRPIGEGWLLALQVRASTGSPRVGQVWGRVELVRGSSGAVQPLATILQGYVTDTQGLAWPGSVVRRSIDGPGAIRSIAGSDPVASSELGDTVPTNARWRPLAIQFTLVTEATAANREVSLVIDDGTNVFVRVPVGTVQTASLTRIYSFAIHTPRNTIAQDGTLNAPLPELVIGDGFRIRTITANLQATDNYGAPRYLVEEWIED